MASSDAIVPERFSPIDPLATNVATEEKEVVKLTAAEADVASLTNHPGWVQVRTWVEEIATEHRTMKLVDIKDPDFAKVGQACVVSTMVADVLEGILKRVEQLHEQANKSRT